MYNSPIPDRAELPSTGRLLRSTLLAAVIAALLLITVVMPAEYGVDPTGVGSVLGLKAMGDAKLALAKEAVEAPASVSRPSPAAVQPPQAKASVAEIPAPASRSDEKSYLLKAGQGMEVKLAMLQGARVDYSWEATDGVVNFDAHGESDSQPVQSHSYKKGTAAAADKGTLEAKFSGNHGWYWRNRGHGNVVINLRVKGAYSAIERVL